jgi:hypothetical protein
VDTAGYVADSNILPLPPAEGEEDGAVAPPAAGYSTATFSGSYCRKAGKIYLGEDAYITLHPPFGVTNYTLYYRLDGGAPATYREPIAAAALSEGAHTLTYYCVHDGVQEAAQKLQIFKDATPPTLELLTKTDAAGVIVTAKSTIRLCWDAQDEGVSGVQCSIQVDEQEPLEVGAVNNYTLSQLADGTHVIYIKAYDLLGNTATLECTLAVDTKPPTLYIISPKPYAELTETEITVVWYAVDRGTGVAYYEVALDEGTPITVENRTLYNAYTFAEVDKGYHVVYVRAVDRVGNAIVEACAFKVTDTKAPHLQALPQQQQAAAERALTFTDVLLIIIIALIIISWLLALRIYRRSTAATAAPPKETEMPTLTPELEHRPKRGFLRKSEVEIVRERVRGQGRQPPTPPTITTPPPKTPVRRTKPLQEQRRQEMQKALPPSQK